MHSSALRKLKRTFSGKFLSSGSTEEDVEDNEASGGSCLKPNAQLCSCKSPILSDNSKDKEAESPVLETTPFKPTNEKSVVCRQCNKRLGQLKKSSSPKVSFSENVSFSSIDEESSSDFLLKSDQNSNNFKVKLRSQSVNSTRSQHIFRRFSSPSFSGDPDFPYGQLESYENLGLLGEGSYAKVFKGKSKYSGEMVALKEISLNSEEGTPFTAIREVSLLKTLNHANIVTLFDIIHTESTLTLVFEFMYTDLSSYMEKLATAFGAPTGINPQNAVFFTFQLLRGLDYCHKRKVLHRDLKPQNLLLSAKGELKLADFGLARAKSIPTNTYSNEVVTLWYRPPDVLLGSTNYSACLDMWGVGCIFLEMLTGMPVFPGQTDAQDELNKIFEILGTPTPQTWKDLNNLPYYEEYYNSCFLNTFEALHVSMLVPALNELEFGEEFVNSLLQYDPKLRPSAMNSMRHCLFNFLPKEIHFLKDEESILSIKEICLKPETEKPR